MERRADCHREGPGHFSGGWNFSAAESGVGDDAAPFLRIEEEGLVFLLVEVMRNVNWAAEGESKIVPAKWRTSDGVQVVEEVIRVQLVVAEEFISASVELAGAAAGGHGDLTAGAAPWLGQVVTALHAELLEGINTWVGEK